MKFSTTITFLTTLTLLSSALADGIFAITGSSSTSSDAVTVTLEVQNGNVGDAPTCQGSYTGSLLPTSGTIPCNDGYALSYTWNSVDEGIAATYTDPTNAFTYNVPNNGCDDAGDCQFGFTDLFPSKKGRAFRG
ncbi:uncharacterized protein LY89DRAFT_730227 [Mollisia scopiformis]|uniref:Uncharacterized protein n=1 Tax=Mollisia scopiformis TaxID=149040 RepID=A0A194XMR5_MOLSC|nr:uncharacterized protein LY89DRAFT_730227 [Mollisia scopiformis]KUJ21448.1 hypothetical protein LY89DRAFT_730227 [Mollisia scopiformis]